MITKIMQSRDMMWVSGQQMVKLLGLITKITLVRNLISKFIS